MSVPREYVCYQVAESFHLTGSLDKPFWRDAPWTEEFVDIEGDIQPRPRYRTRAKMLWDDKYLYIGAEMEEPHVWGTLTEHDAVIFQDNDFEVFIDPNGDNHDYYELEINALNTTWDLRLVKPYRDGGPALNEWEIHGFLSAVAIDGTLNDARDVDRGWSVEMAFPWMALAEYALCGSPPRDGDQWRMNFSRVQWDVTVEDGEYRKMPGHPEHNWVWSPQGVVDMHRPETWGYVQFSTAAPGTAEFVPDPAAPARDRLMQVYHVQQGFHKQHGRWAATWDELGADNPEGLKLVMTPDGFEARYEVALAEGTVCWQVRQDSRLWSDNSSG